MTVVLTTRNQSKHERKNSHVRTSQGERYRLGRETPEGPACGHLGLGLPVGGQ